MGLRRFGAWLRLCRHRRRERLALAELKRRSAEGHRPERGRRLRGMRQAILAL